MPLELFRCPVCSGTFKVQMQPTAYQVRCGHCSAVVTIPGDPALTKETAPPAKQAAAAPPSKEPAGTAAKPRGQAAAPGPADKAAQQAPTPNAPLFDDEELAPSAQEDATFAR